MTRPSGERDAGRAGWCRDQPRRRRAGTTSSRSHSDSFMRIAHGCTRPSASPRYWVTSAPKYFSEILASVPSARSSPSALSTACRKVVAALAEDEGAERRVVGLGGYLQAGVALLLLVVEVREVVVDGGVDAALLEQRHGLRPALDGLDLGAALLRELVPVARERLGGGLAGQIGERGDIGVVALHDDHAGLTVYGSEKSYLALRSSLMDTWLAITSKRPASRPAKMASHWVSSNFTSTPSFSATAVMISTS